MNFETNTVDLSLINAESGLPLTSNVYDVTFDDGTRRTMSIGQLVMAICLERATEMEADVIEIMERMAGTTVNIDALADIQGKIVAQTGDDLEGSVFLRDITGDWEVSYTDPYTGLPKVEVVHNAQVALEYIGVDTVTGSASLIIEDIESKLDELNTTSQEQMITLQSQTNKRDQSYEMISNVLKSLFTVMSGVVNNY